MPTARIVTLTTLVMLAFAGNSLLCRVALKDTNIDAASFTAIRLISGGLMLWLVVQLAQGAKTDKHVWSKGRWRSALALFAYAAGFSFAYITLTAATGALLLFGAVQVTMIGYGLKLGERLHGMQLVGFMLALSGVTGLLLPGLAAPPLLGAALMICAGVAWGIYSLRGKGTGDPTQITAGNFLRAVPIAILLLVVRYQSLTIDVAGFWYAVASGALTSGIGYAIWYCVLPALKAVNAAIVQLSVPVIAAVGGVLLLGEAVTLRLVLASAAILGGIALVVVEKRRTGPRNTPAR